MKYEEILQKINGFGKYQKKIIFLLMLSTIPNGFYTMIPVFILDSPNHYCRVSAANDTISNDSVSWMNKTIPWEQEEDGLWKRSKCRRYANVTTDELAYLNMTTIPCNDGWVYETFFGEITAVMEWDLVCDKSYYIPLITSLFMMGVLVGSVLSGHLSDRYGRRPVFLWGTLLQFAAMLGAGFSTNAVGLTITWFLSGCSSLINYVSAFVIATEIVDSSKRALVGTLEIAGFTLGYMLLAPVAYFLTTWRWLMWFIGSCGILFIPYYWWIPESPRWLIMRGRKEAVEVLRKIAKENGTILEKSDWEQIEYESHVDNEINEKYNYLDLLRHPTIRKRTLNMFFIWFATSLTYFCISLNTSNLGGNKFVNCFVASAVEVPAYTLSFFLMQKAGRRLSLFSFLLVGGIACAVAPLFYHLNETIMIGCAMISKFCVTAVFSIIYICCCELFPTKMRNMSVSASSTMARIGGIAAPYLIYAGQSVSRYIPYVLMGICMIASAFSCLLFPETLNVPLPETLKDAVELDRYKLVICGKEIQAEDKINKTKNTPDEIPMIKVQAEA